MEKGEEMINFLKEGLRRLFLICMLPVIYIWRFLAWLRDKIIGDF